MISISLNLLLLFLFVFYQKKRYIIYIYMQAGKTLWSLPLSKAGYLKFCLMIVIIIARLYLAHQYQLAWLWPIFKVSIAKQLKMKFESCIVSLVIQTEFTVVMWKVIYMCVCMCVCVCVCVCVCDLSFFYHYIFLVFYYLKLFLFLPREFMLSLDAVEVRPVKFWMLMPKLSFDRLSLITNELKVNNW